MILTQESLFSETAQTTPRGEPLEGTPYMKDGIRVPARHLLLYNKPAGDGVVLTEGCFSLNGIHRANGVPLTLNMDPHAVLGRAYLTGDERGVLFEPHISADAVELYVRRVSVALGSLEWRPLYVVDEQTWRDGQGHAIRARIYEVSLVTKSSVTNDPSMHVLAWRS